MAPVQSLLSKGSLLSPKEASAMPSIDVHAPGGVFTREAERRLAERLGYAALAAEGLEPTPFLLDKTWVRFQHGSEVYTGSGAIADRPVRVLVFAPAGRLGPEAKRELVRRVTQLVAEAAGDPAQEERTFVLILETADGGWGLAGRTGGELVEWALDRAAGAIDLPSN
jgi:phenylpyruvate tautomerase PptA (4-oxalocrotonate tautomerase family)